MTFDYQFSPDANSTISHNGQYAVEITDSCSPIIERCIVHSSASVGAALCVRKPNAMPQVKHCTICDCENVGIFVTDQGQVRDLFVWTLGLSVRFKVSEVQGLSNQSFFGETVTSSRFIFFSGYLRRYRNRSKLVSWRVGEESCQSDISSLSHSSWSGCGRLHFRAWSRK